MPQKSGNKVDGLDAEDVLDDNSQRGNQEVNTRSDSFSEAGGIVNNSHASSIDSANGEPGANEYKKNALQFNSNAANALLNAIQKSLNEAMQAKQSSKVSSNTDSLLPLSTTSSATISPSSEAENPESFARALQSYKGAAKEYGLSPQEIATAINEAVSADGQQYQQVMEVTRPEQIQEALAAAMPDAASVIVFLESVRVVDENQRPTAEGYKAVATLIRTKLTEHGLSTEDLGSTSDSALLGAARTACEAKRPSDNDELLTTYLNALKRITELQTLAQKAEDLLTKPDYIQRQAAGEAAGRTAASGAGKIAEGFAELGAGAAGAVLHGGKQAAYGAERVARGAAGLGIAGAQLGVAAAAQGARALSNTTGLVGKALTGVAGIVTGVGAVAARGAMSASRGIEDTGIWLSRKGSDLKTNHDRKETRKEIARYEASILQARELYLTEDGQKQYDTLTKERNVLVAQQNNTIKDPSIIKQIEDLNNQRYRLFKSHAKEELKKKNPGIVGLEERIQEKQIRGKEDKRQVEKDSRALLDEKKKSLRAGHSDALWRKSKELLAGINTATNAPFEAASYFNEKSVNIANSAKGTAVDAGHNLLARPDDVGEAYKEAHEKGYLPNEEKSYFDIVKNRLHPKTASKECATASLPEGTPTRTKLANVRGR